MTNPGTLYVVATPIGNLEDISIRALKTLFTVDAIACEDTRRSGLLLKNLEKMYNILVYYTQGQKGVKEVSFPKLVSYYEQNEDRRIPEIISALKNGLNIALISDAGTPTISDPGFRLVRECIGEGVSVISLPGPSSVITALVSSGLPTDKFLFLGYPPRKPGHRMKFFENTKKSLETIRATVILFEAPHKLVKTLEELGQVFGDIEVTLARELTKVHEETNSEKISSHLASFDKRKPKGEFVVMFNY